MTALINCPQCGLQGEAPDGFQTSQTRCPRCDTIIAVPAAAPPAAPAPLPANGHRDPFNQVLDQFFAGAYAQRPRASGPGPLPPLADGSTIPPEIPSRPPPDPHADPRIEREWLREEHERLQAYMRRHFAAIGQQRQEFDGWRSRVEAALMGREQELNRQKKILASQLETLQQREAAPPVPPRKVDEESSVLRQTAEQLRQEIAAEQARLAELRKATASVKADFLGLENAVRNRKQAAEQGQAERELGELERQIRGELERQEQDLARQRRELQEWRDQVVQESCEKDILRRKVGTLARELEQLRRSAGDAAGKQR